jgi:hypothetical protein
MKQPPLDNVVPLPGSRSATLVDIWEELKRLRELVEQLVLARSDSRQWLTVDEAATLLHRTPQAVRFRCRQGLGVKVQGQWRIRRDQLRN